MSYTIKSLSRKLSLSEQYIRKMIRAKRLESTLVAINSEETIHRHEMSEAQVQAWLDNRGEGIQKRSDGRNKYTMYLTPEEATKVAAPHKIGSALFFKGQSFKKKS